ncbi:hypothetical protein [Caballeronia sp. BR00000012568055]|uniref:hypothetical protein n=1 Tax=Caballeronia sp. BR00000012568055 TaxID=2918761 RepID=UPI0023F9BA66|nr:hypothetical protein [Caballeronia sp. BR00000012568055]
MAYSCTDLVDDVLNDMLGRGWIKSSQYGPEDTGAQASAVMAAIGEADHALCLAADAKQFHAELIDAVETLTGIGEQHGVLALANILYLHMALLNDTFIELSVEDAQSLAFVRALPSGARWWARVKVLDASTH